MTHREQFLTWWKDDEERNKCFLSQAMDAYVRSFPARVLPLLCELVEDREEPTSQTALCPKCNRWGIITDDGVFCPFCDQDKPPSTTDHDLSVPGIAEQGDPTGGSVEVGVINTCHSCRYWENKACMRYPPPAPDVDEYWWCGEWSEK